MAPAAPAADTTTTVPPPPPDAPKVDASRSAVLTEAQSLGPELQAIEDKTQGQVGAVESERGKIKPPKYQAVPPPTAPVTDPQKAWSSAAMILAAIGSLATRQPMTTAMNAAAAVLNAYKAKDQATADAAFSTWKIASENATKAFQYEQDSYHDAMSEFTNRETQIGKQGDREERNAIAKVDALAHAFQDDAMLQQKSIDDKLRLLEFRALQKQKLETQAPKLIENKAFVDAWNDWKQKNPNATPQEQADAVSHLKQQFAPSHSWTPSSAASMEQRIAQSLTASDLGKAYSAAARNYQTVKTFAGGGAVPQAALADAYTQLINGGRAIRGFQMQMNTQHASLWDKGQIALAQLNKGGPLSPQMIHDMVSLSGEIVKERQGQFSHAIEHAEQRAKNMGLDPRNVVPDIDDPTSMGQGGGQPTPVTDIPSEAVAMLKKSPNDQTKKQFDDVFGQGTAEKILGH